VADVEEGKESRKDQILRTATRIFCEKTYHGTTLQDIADAVGMLKGSLYYYITSKEKLLTDIILDAAHTLNKDLERVERANLPPTARLKQIIQEHIKFNTMYRESGTLFLTDRNAISSLEMNELMEIFDRRDKLIVRTLNEAVEMGIYRPVDIRVTALAIAGLCNSTLFWYQPSGRLNYNDVADIFFDLLNQGLAVRS